MFEKRNLLFAGRSIPAVQAGPDEHTTVTLSSGKIIPATFADMISLRETNPANGPVTTYLTLTRENKRFMTLRFDHVVGLDVAEDGTMLTLEDLERQRTEDILARQAVNAAAKAPILFNLNEILDLNVEDIEPEAG